VRGNLIEAQENDVVIRTDAEQIGEVDKVIRYLGRIRGTSHGSRIESRLGVSDGGMMSSSLIAKHGGRVLARTDETVSLEAEWHPPRIVIVEFPRVEVTQGRHALPEYPGRDPVRLGLDTMHSMAFEALMA
jgi:uncharacterized protein (DUF1330 family)